MWGVVLELDLRLVCAPGTGADHGGGAGQEAGGGAGAAGRSMDLAEDVYGPFSGQVGLGPGPGFGGRRGLGLGLGLGAVRSFMYGVGPVLRGGVNPNDV